MTKHIINLIVLGLLCYFFLSVNVTTTYAFNICGLVGLRCDIDECQIWPLLPNCQPKPALLPPVPRVDCDTDSGRCDSPIRSQPAQSPQPAASPSRGSPAPASPAPVINQPTSNIVPPSTVCTPGEFKIPPECTGRCQGCFAGTGEARIFQCRADGSGFDEKQSECRTECAGSCQPDQALSTPQPAPAEVSPSRSTPTEAGGNPSGTITRATPQPTQEVRPIGYHISESPIPANVISPTVRVNSFPTTIQFNFTDRSPGTKTVFVRFFYSNGTYRDSQKSIIYRPAVPSPSPTSSPNPSMLPSATITSVTKPTVAEDEDININFTTNGKADYVNLIVGEQEQSDIRVRLSKGTTTGSLTLPATHETHKLGDHYLSLRAYNCISSDAQGNPTNCTAGTAGLPLGDITVKIVPSNQQCPGRCGGADRINDVPEGLQSQGNGYWSWIPGENNKYSNWCKYIQKTQWHCYQWQPY